MPEQLRDAPDLPELGAHIWQWFIELNSERDFGFDGPRRLRYSDMLEWSQAFGVRIERWELRALRLIDNVWLKGDGNEQ